MKLPQIQLNPKEIPIKKYKKTLVACPTTGFMLPEMVNCLIALLTKSPNWAGYHSVDNCVIQAARNQAVKRMLESGCDGILFIDADQVFPENALELLIEAHKDIIGYPIARKSAPYYPNIGKYDEEKNDFIVYENYPKNNLFQVDYIGMGFTYIRREVFEKISKDNGDEVWFDFDWCINDKYKRGEKMIGEDVYFCAKAKKAGFKVWCNPFANIGHIGNFNYTTQLYFNYERMRQEAEKGNGGK